MMSTFLLWLLTKRAMSSVGEEVFLEGFVQVAPHRLSTKGVYSDSPCTFCFAEQARLLRGVKWGPERLGCA